MTLREQPGVPTTFRRHTPDTSLESALRHSVGTASGIHPEDHPYQTDERRRQGTTKKTTSYNDAEDIDTIYNTRVPSSTRRYRATPATTPPRTVMRVTRHKGPPPIQRASRTQEPASQERERTRLQRSTKSQVHWSVSIGIGMVCVVIGWILLSSFFHWWQIEQDNLHYGMPRTFQIDANVRHGGISHFTVENLNRHIFVYEIQRSDVTKPHLYSGPIFSEADAETQLATISFEDVNNDAYPDMIITVANGRYPFINDHRTFRQLTEADHLSGKGV